MPEWKWDHVTMDFVTGLPTGIKSKHNAVWVVVDRLTKSAYFIAISETDGAEDIAARYIDEIVRLYGVPISIVSDRDTWFTSHFWKAFQKALGTRVNLSTTYHPQTDGQSERTIQTLEDMLRACVLDWGGNWKKYLRLVEFAYSNSYQASIGMSPYEALYGRACRTPLCWTPVGERMLFSPKIMDETTEKMKFLKIKLKEAQDRQKSYADKRCKELEFQVIERVGDVAYKLKLPPKLDAFHKVFHVSQLRKCLSEHEERVEDVPSELKENLTVEANPIRIVDRMEKGTRWKRINMIKVLWNCGGREKTTWETENKMKADFSKWFKEMGKDQLESDSGTNPFKGEGRLVTPAILNRIVDETWSEKRRRNSDNSASSTSCRVAQLRSDNCPTVGWLGGYKRTVGRLRKSGWAVTDDGYQRVGLVWVEIVILNALGVLPYIGGEWVTARPYTSSSRATTVHQLECQLTGPPSWVSTRSVHRARLSCRSAHLAELASPPAGLAHLAELASSSSSPSWISSDSFVTARPYTSSSRATTVHQLECQLTGPSSWVSTRSVHRARLSCRSAHLAELASPPAGLAHLAELASSSSSPSWISSDSWEWHSQGRENGPKDLAEKERTKLSELIQLSELDKLDELASSARGCGSASISGIGIDSRRLNRTDAHATSRSNNSMEMFGWVDRTDRRRDGSVQMDRSSERRDGSGGAIDISTMGWYMRNNRCFDPRLISAD
ncbi:Ribonuclease H-like superfamily [Arabidopsis suecica]|uniref:Ribonuclease H-like superfamily n=1 Tax=Arabidopsis suecica TaxID=45249 RepID=A0A8T2AEW1_ARASU|nr:Ribonuclease H-like superfamily [Arabidopsis suecica]